MEKYLIALDMDGTLLNRHGKVSKKTVEVLNSLIRKGHYIVPASGRAFTILPKEILELEEPNGDELGDAGTDTGKNTVPERDHRRGKLV